MAPQRLPARTVDLSQEHKYLLPPTPQPVRSQCIAFIRMLARESGFILLVLVMFTLSLSVSHAMHRWNQPTTDNSGSQRIVWSTVFERPPDRSQPPAEVQQLANSQLARTGTPPRVVRSTQARTGPRHSRNHALPSVSRTGKQQRHRPQARGRTVSPEVQPIQQILQKDYGQRADKSYQHYMHWVDTTLADYQRP
ncbi:MAG: hypothetical protein IGS03_01235 [Candidatus Sericytochromatia bacterium]|nr:hypothetical protein [Candidatus Sericytochromatia bacterium]